MKKKTQTTVITPISSALVAAEQILGKNRTWRPQTKEQKQFISDYFVYRNELGMYSKEELRNWVDWVAANLNAILKKEGFNIELEDFLPGEFGVVSILDVLVEWLKEGEKFDMTVGKKKFPAVRMSNHFHDENGHRRTMFEVYRFGKYKNPVVNVNTKSGDMVYMTVADKGLEGLELARHIDDIRGQTQSHDLHQILEFPMVNLDQEVDISWLIGLETSDDNGDDWEISQAKQQTKFKMNHKGARVKSAVAIGVMKTTAIMPVKIRTLKINKPFYLWIERPGAHVPVMYGYFNKESWMDPGSLSNI